MGAGRIAWRTPGDTACPRSEPVTREGERRRLQDSMGAEPRRAGRPRRSRTGPSVETARSPALRVLDIVLAHGPVGSDGAQVQRLEQLLRAFRWSNRTPKLGPPLGKWPSTSPEWHERQTRLVHVHDGRANEATLPVERRITAHPGIHAGIHIGGDLPAHLLAQDLPIAPCKPLGLQSRRHGVFHGAMSRM